MAFEKRTWFARLGLGLNKFIIGEKDAEGKQELTNSPDSVTQQGDVISADNLNDLEDRIANAFSDFVWVKSWQNPSPTEAFTAQDVSFGNDTEIVIEYKEYRTDDDTKFVHLKRSSSRHDGSIFYAGAGSNGVIVANREISQGQVSGTLIFDDAYLAVGSSASTVNNDYLIPIAIYSVQTQIS